MLFAHYQVPVHSLVILLRTQAAHSNLNGLVSYSTRSGRGSINFTYEVVRLWERPAEQFLTGTLGTLPLAVLGVLPEGVPTQDGLTSIAQRIISRVEHDAPVEQGRRLLTAAFLLTGLLVTRSAAKQAFRGVRQMRDSDTYLAILEEGREEEVKKLIIQLGRKKFGTSEATAVNLLNGISDLARLERIHERLLDATNWQDLLDTP